MKMENGKWKMENGKWKMEERKGKKEWKVENGKWKMENGDEAVPSARVEIVPGVSDFIEFIF
ncbi:MAG: hypothetical protein IPG02_04040 [Ignavibacteria bacterium]|nr:hypothetical protein [Ignavibacteria bacterium]